jgi:hypothetical protein
MLPLDVLLWQHGAEFEAPGAAAGATAGREPAPAQTGAPRVVLEPGAARAALTLYARLLRAVLGPAAALPAGQRPDRAADFRWSGDGMQLGGVPVALSVSQGVPRHRLPLGDAAGSGAPTAGAVGIAPLPRLPHRVGKGDPAATRLRVTRFVAVGAWAARPAETALALHRLVALVGGAAAPIPARLPGRGDAPLPALTHLPAAERTAILEALAHSRAYPPAAEEAITAHLSSRVARPLLEEPARPRALEDALMALLQLTP